MSVTLMLSPEKIKSYSFFHILLSRLSMCSTYKFQGRGRSGESKGWKGRDGSNLNELEGLVNTFGPMRILLIVGKRNSGDILQQQKLYYCGVSREQELGEWREAVGNLDRVCGVRKNFADVLIKNLATNCGEEKHIRNLFITEERSSVFV